MPWRIEIESPVKKEKHFIQRSPWLRAAVLGANDGIISTASLILGFISAHSTQHTILLSGLAGLGAGALSMASGEYVSVSSQSDIEQADLKRERRELNRDFESERKELAGLFVSRGLSAGLASQVASEMMAKDPLGAHAREELGIDETTKANPIQAAFASALSFTLGALLPILTVFLSPLHLQMALLIACSIFCLGGLGYLSAFMGGAPRWRAVARVCLWGSLAMGITSAIGNFVG